MSDSDTLGIIAAVPVFVAGVVGAFAQMIRDRKRDRAKLDATIADFDRRLDELTARNAGVRTNIDRIHRETFGAHCPMCAELTAEVARLKDRGPYR